MTRHDNPARFKGEATTERGALNGSRYVVHETAQESEANKNGTITVPAGEQVVVLEWEDNGPLHLYAIGANDAADLYYELVLDGAIVASTHSPLGTLNNPFSFVDQLGEPVEATNRIQLRIRNEGTTDRNIAGRAHIGVMG